MTSPYVNFECRRALLAIDDFQARRISSDEFRRRLTCCGYSSAAINAEIEQQLSLRKPEKGGNDVDHAYPVATHKR